MRVKITDMTVPLEKNIQLTYVTKIQKYGRLKHKITEMWSEIDHRSPHCDFGYGEHACKVRESTERS